MSIHFIVNFPIRPIIPINFTLIIQIFLIIKIIPIHDLTPILIIFTHFLTANFIIMRSLILFSKFPPLLAYCYPHSPKPMNLICEYPKIFETIFE